WQGFEVDRPAGELVRMTPWSLRETVRTLDADQDGSPLPIPAAAMRSGGQVRVVPGRLAALERRSRLPGLPHRTPVMLVRTESTTGRTTILADPITVEALTAMGIDVASWFVDQALPLPNRPVDRTGTDLRGLAWHRALTPEVMDEAEDRLAEAESLLGRRETGGPHADPMLLERATDVLDRLSDLDGNEPAGVGAARVAAASRRLAKARYRVASLHRMQPRDLAEWQLGFAQTGALAMQRFEAEPGAAISVATIAEHVVGDESAFIEAVFLHPYLTFENDDVVFPLATAIEAGFQPVLRGGVEALELGAPATPLHLQGRHLGDRPGDGRSALLRTMLSLKGPLRPL
ncbi:MAG: hypothetical protein ACRD0H_03070, partial [Actinomycetes bacterium]